MMRVNHLTIVDSISYDPYVNLAMEEWLLGNVRKDEVIFYLWQNQHTVVIGKNQNAYKECLVDALIEDHGKLARRNSGGGAVYHDLGNLNFTFLMHQENYDVKRQCEIIADALAQLGIHAEVSGRNDITVNHKKISGNAFYSCRGRNYHHGTLLMNVELSQMQKFLVPSAAKLKSKGVDSVKARVANLIEFAPTLTLQELKGQLIQAAKRCYQCVEEYLEVSAEDNTQIQHLAKHYQSEKWLYGVNLAFEIELAHRFDWGEVQFQLKLNQGIIQDDQIYGDVMDVSFIESLRGVLIGCPYRREAIIERLQNINVDKQNNSMKNDICEWFSKEMIV